MSDFKLTNTEDVVARSFSASQFPMDGSMPQWSEGAEYSQLRTVYTPKKSGSTLIIDVHILCMIGAGGQIGDQAFLFKGASITSMENDALSGGTIREAVDRYGSGQSPGSSSVTTRSIRFIHKMETSSLDPITFAVRCGTNYGTFFVNQYTDGLSSSISSSLQITEIY